MNAEADIRCGHGVQITTFLIVSQKHRGGSCASTHLPSGVLMQPPAPVFRGADPEDVRASRARRA